MNEYADDEEIIEAPILETDEEATDVPIIQPDADSQGPTYERADAEPFQPVPKARDDWNQYEDRKILLDRAARAAAEGDASKAARIRAVHDNYSFSRMEIEENIERLEARMKRERARKALDGAPVTASFLDETPADAPIFQNDLDLLAKTEQAFSQPLIAVNPLSGKPYDRWGSKRAEPVYYADEDTEGLPEDLRQEIAYQRTGWEMLANDVERGFGTGVATTQEGALWGRVMRGEASLSDPEVQARLQSIKDDLSYYESDVEQGAFYHAGNLAGSMVGSAPEATGLATGTALVGLGLGLAGAPVGGLALLGAALTAGLWDATSRVESGLSYKTLIEAGAEPAKARQIANAVGVVNATIETGLTAGMGAATAKIMKPFLSPVVDKVAARFARGMAEPSVSRAFGKGVMLWGVGAASESATEVLQEVSSMIGEEVGRLYADANIDPLTRESAVDRLVETAWATFRGALVLAGPGVAGGFGGVLAAKARADARVMRVQQMVEAVQQMEAVQTAPAAVEQVLAKQAEGTPNATIYVDGIRFAESLQQAGISREDLKAVAPEVEAQIDAAVEAGTDVEIPSATYVTRIAPTKLGEATMPHIRMSPEELSQAEAAEAVKDFNTLTREIAQGGDVDRIVETADQRVAKIANDEERAALKAFEAKLVEDMTAATEGNTAIPENTIRGQAKLATMAALVQAKRVKMPVQEFIDRFAPRVVSGRATEERSAASLSQEGRTDAVQSAEVESPEAKLAREAKAWADSIDAMKEKPKQPVVMLKQTPLAMHLVGADFLTLRAHPHLFDGIFADAERSNPRHNAHVEMSRSVLKQIPEALADPIAIFRDERRDAFVFMLDVVDDAGNTVVVPVVFNAHGRNAEINLATTAYGKENKLWFATQSQNDAVVYANSKKMRRWNTSSGSNSLRGSNASGRSVLTEADLVKLQSEFPGFYEDRGGVRGSFSPSQRTITLTPNADLSTFSHEMGHWYLSTLFEMSKVEGASATVLEDAQTMLKQFGVESVDAWDALGVEGQRKHHEQFAHWTEVYFATGKAPNSATQRFFSRLGAWIRDVYRLFRGNAVDAIGENYRREFGEALPELSDEVRRVLDRMIVSEDMLDDALAAEGLKPLFDRKPDDMSEADWAELQLARDDAEQEGIEILHKLRAKDEAWAAKAQSAELKKIQAQAKEERDKIRAKVSAEVNSEPAFAAAEIIRRGNKAAVTFNLKMDPDAVASFGLNANQMAQLRAKGFLKKGGLDPQATFNELRLISVKFPNARKMLEALVRVGDPEEIIERRTTERCIAEHSELFDPKKVQAAVHKAVHQEARARMVATELKYIAGDRRARSRVYLEAARMAAREQLGRIAVGKLRVSSLVAAERRASTEAYRAIKAGDRAKAVSAKRRQLVLHEMIRTAIKFEDDFRKFQKLRKDAFGSAKKIAKTRDMDIVSVVRYVLTNEGYGKASNDATAAPKFVEKLQKYNDERAAVFAAILERHPYRPGLEWKNRSVADAIAVVEEVTGLWRMAAMERSVYLNGRREDRKAIAEELCSTRLQAGDYKAGFNRKTTPAEAVTHKLLTVSNMLKAVESWCVRMDGHDPDGPWQKYIYRPIANGAAKYRVESVKFQKRLAELAEARAENWAKVRDIHFAYGNYTFLTKAELIGALLHTGNMSNKTKLLVGGRSEGRTWARVHYVNGQEFVDMSGWDSFVEECFENGTITKEDMDFVQAVWDLLEETKAPAQKAFRQIFGFYFEEVEASPIETPWGTYRGGYVPAITDHDLVHDQKLKEEREIQGEQDFLSAMPVKTPGFSVSRVEQYRKPLNLDFGRLGAHIDKVLRFAYIAPQATEVAKLLNDFDVQDHLAAFDPTARTDLLQVWLKRSTEQSLTTDRSSWVGQKVNKLRSLAGANIMAGNIVNAMQQVTGLSVAVPYVGAKALWQAHKTFFLNPKDTVRRISEASNFMKNRFHDRAMEYQSRLRRASAGTIHMDQAKTMFDKMATVDAKLEPVRDFFMRNAYILQSVVQVPIDGIVWLAAYNKYLSEHGRTGDGWFEYEPARDYADSIVRRTQSDFSPENIANVEAGNSATRLFLVFYRYFGTMLNLLSDSWDRAKLTGDYGRFVADAFFIAWLPSVISAAIARLFGGGFDEDDDGFDGMDAFQLFVGEPLKGVIAMVPFLGGAINAGGAALAKAGSTPAQAIFGTDPYVGRIYSSPAFDLLETSGGGLLDLYRLTQGKEVNARKITREMLDLTSVVTGLPFGALKRPLGYVAGVKDGQYEEPANPFEAVSGLVSGKGKEE